MHKRCSSFRRLRSTTIPSLRIHGMDRLFAFILRRLCKVLHGMSNAQIKISDAYTQRVLMYCCSANVNRFVCVVFVARCHACSSCLFPRVFCLSVILQCYSVWTAKPPRSLHKLPLRNFLTTTKRSLKRLSFWCPWCIWTIFQAVYGHVSF